MEKKNGIDVARLPKYASLLSDSGFKAVLASPRNKDVLTKLLNLVLPEERKIDEIEAYDDREMSGFTPFSKSSRVDIRCRDIHGRTFIVEMQREMHDYFFERCMWYGSNSYGHGLPVGAKYDALKPVYVIAFLEERLPHADEGQWKAGECVSYYQMTEKRTGEVAPETIICIFVELGRFIAGEKELSDSFGKACYVFKNSEKWDAESVPAEILEDDVARDLTRACEVANFPPDVKLNYVRDMFTEMDYHAEMDEAFKRGARQNARENAKKLMTAGIPADVIASCTGLSVNDVQSLAH